MSRKLQLREGIAPTRDRLTTTVFMAALVHGVIIVGVTFGSSGQKQAGAPGLEVLIVSEDVPEARRNDTRRRDAALTSGAQYVSTDYMAPDARLGTYRVALPDAAVARCSPVTAIAACSPQGKP